MEQNSLYHRSEQLIQNLADSLSKGHTDEFMAYLQTVSRFHRYSVNNQMLIAFQFPTATRVAGLRKWNELGRRVIKGQKGIRILAPIIKKVTEDDGREVQKLVGFRDVCVFDISQTEGDDLPQPTMATGEIGEAELRLFMARTPVPSIFRDDLGEARGATNGREIYLNSRLLANPSQLTKTLIHEWAHVLLHFDEDRPLINIREAEAESVAYVVATMLGIQADDASRDYLVNWGADADVLSKSLHRISKAVKMIAECLQMD